MFAAKAQLSLIVTATATANAASYRLSSAGLAGRSNTGGLEVNSCTDASPCWKSVCSQTQDGSDAGAFTIKTACQSLGFEPEGSLRKIEHPVAVSGEVLAPSCTQTESSLDDCSTLVTAADGQCGQLLGLHCQAKATTFSDWEYRMVGAGGNEKVKFGHVEARPTSTGVWQNVTAGEFNGGANKFAEVACESLYPGMVSKSSVFAMGEVSDVTNVMLENLFCDSYDIAAGLAGCRGNFYNVFSDAVWPGVMCVLNGVTQWPTGADAVLEYQLADQVLPGRGRLEIKPRGGKWGGVCSTMATDQAFLNRACKSLGYETATAMGLSTFGGSAGDMQVGSADCEAGTDLSNCVLSGLKTCSNFQVVGVDCMVPEDASTSWQWRLVDPTDDSVVDTTGKNVVAGRLEGRKSSSDVWGTVSSTYFEAGKAACSTLGFPVGGSMELVTGGPESMPIHWAEVRCNDAWVRPGHTTSLSYCSFSSRFDLPQWYSDGYGTHNRDVGVWCSKDAQIGAWQYRITPEAGDQDGQGRVEIAGDADGNTPWGTMCQGANLADSNGLADWPEYFDFEAVRICRSAGYTKVNTATLKKAQSAGKGPIYLNNPRCSIFSESLDECRQNVGHGSGWCDHRDDVAVDCQCDKNDCTRTVVEHLDVVLPVVTPAAGQHEFRLVHAKNVSGSVYGRFEVRPSSSAEWGQVCMQEACKNNPWSSTCQYGMTSFTAELACRSLGFDAVAETPSANFFHVFAGEGAAYINAPSCAATATDFNDCTWTDESSDSCFANSLYGKQHYATGLRCTTNTAATLPKWGLRVLNGTSAEAAEGRLEIQPRPGMPWGTVCTEGFTNTDAKVACDGAGYNAGVLATEQVTTGLNLTYDDMALNYISAVSCTGSEDTLQECKADWFHHCSATDSVHITCSGKRATVSSQTSSSSTGSTSSVGGPMSAVAAVVCAALLLM